MGSALYIILITPIQLFIEIVFSFMNTAFDNPGFAIIFVSIAVQLLCFPLYKRADVIQEQDRQKQKEMKPWLDHIKKTFKGDERFMMQQAYYRLENYKPFYAIKGSISLLLQIPFFIAAYDFLSNLEILKGTPFFAINDLSQPDQLIHIGAVTLNLLPILMTFFNIISGIIYTKGFPVKDKVQTYGLACIFLVILYKSPSGLVFYWTLNNLFSLLKNVFMKLVKNPQRVIRISLAAIGVIAPVYVILFSGRSAYLKLFSLAFAVVCFLPTVVHLLKKKSVSIPDDSKTDSKLYNSLFYWGITVLFLLLACVIPVQVIKASPTEFISLNYGPYGLILNTACVYIGILFVWINIFYIFSPVKIKKYFSVIINSLTITGIINYFFFGKNLGTISNTFVYDTYPEFSAKIIILNALLVLAVAAVIAMLCVKKSKAVKTINQILAVSFTALIAVGVVSTEKTLAFEGHPEKTKQEKSLSAEDKLFTFNKNGKNVIVFMLDRAISGYFPFAVEENPQIKEMFDGFTYYPNTVSFGGSTNFGSPALFGGYDYTPFEENKRTDDSLVSKQNEALTVMPRLFADNNYKVTVLDPPYANYRWNYDVSIYDKYDDINAYETIGNYSYTMKQKYSPLYEAAQKRSFVFFSLMRALPVAAQNPLYQSGYYWSSAPSVDSITTYLNSYTVLENLKNFTDVSDSDENTFLMMQNDTTHEPIVLNEDDFSISVSYKEPNYRKMTSDEGITLDLTDKEKLSHYQTFASSIIKIGEWFDYLKEQGVYDNTRIIIVSDHGRNLHQFDSMMLSNGIDVQSYNPLLLVKDYNAKGFKTSDKFMTNADTPSLATDNTIQNPVNPFTGKAISDKAKNDGNIMITTSENYSVLTNNGNVFDTSDGEWWTVTKNIFDEKNWKKVEVK